MRIDSIFVSFTAYDKKSNVVAHGIATIKEAMRYCDRNALTAECDVISRSEAIMIAGPQWDWTRILFLKKIDDGEEQKD